MRRTAWIACAVLACQLASAADRSAVAAEGAPLKAPAAKARAAEEVDTFSSFLEACPLEKRREFLGSIKFLGDKVVGFDYGPVRDCLGRMTRDDVSNRFSLAGHSGMPNDKVAHDDYFGELFSACSASVRNDFYDRMAFRDGRLIGLFVDGVKKCGEKRDLHRFLSLFGAEGMEEREWKDGCACTQPGLCAPKSNSSCHPGNCRCPARSTSRGGHQ